MNNGQVGSVLLGFGILAEVLIETQQASGTSNFTVWTQGTVWTMILLGVALVAIDIWEQYQAHTDA